MSLYKALNEEDVMKARFNLLEDGEYDAVVKVATPSMSKSNNPMADMTLAVFDKAGNRLSAAVDGADLWPAGSPPARCQRWPARTALSGDVLGDASGSSS